MSKLDLHVKLTINCTTKDKKFRQVKNGNDHDENETQSNIVEELAQVETDEIV